jgi:putative oligomerization/nucleic acid binding protein
MQRILLGVVVVLVAGCAAKKPLEPAPGAETVRVETSHPGPAFFELGPVSGTDGQGCGDDGVRGKRDRAVASLMKNAFAMGGTHVQVMALYEPRQFGDCFVNIYRVSGTAYRQAKPVAAAAPQAPGSDPVQQLRDLQRLRQEGAISDQEYERLKARIIGS